MKWSELLRKQEYEQLSSTSDKTFRDVYLEIISRRWINEMFPYIEDSIAVGELNTLSFKKGWSWIVKNEEGEE